MAYNIKTKFKSIFSRAPSVSPSCYFSASSSPNFCEAPIHDPLFECCCQQHDSKYTNPNLPQKKKLKKRKSAKKIQNQKPTPIEHETLKELNLPTNRSSNSFKIPSNLFLNLDDLEIRPTARNNTITNRTITGRTPRIGLSYEKDCSILQTNRSNNFRNLCDKFENACITPRFLKLYSKVPDHDKKILNRMAIRRIKDSVLAEDTVIAHKFWRQEKAERDQLVHVQNKIYTNVLKSRLQREQQETEDRLAYLDEQDKLYRAGLKKEIEEKYLKVNSRLENLRMVRDMQMCDRRQQEFKKLDTIVSNNYENELDKELKRQETCDRIEEKINQAEKLKTRLINSYRNRVQADNEIARHKHAANYEEVKNVENFRQNRLKQDLFYRDRKFNKFVERKNRLIDASKEQAKTSSELRDIIRNSCTPDTLSFRFPSQQLPPQKMSRTIFNRPISDLSHYSFLKFS